MHSHKVYTVSKNIRQRVNISHCSKKRVFHRASNSHIIKVTVETSCADNESNVLLYIKRLTSVMFAVGLFTVGTMFDRQVMIFSAVSTLQTRKTIE